MLGCLLASQSEHGDASAWICFFVVVKKNYHFCIQLNMRLSDKEGRLYFSHAKENTQYWNPDKTNLCSSHGAGRVGGVEKVGRAKGKE